MTTILVPVDFSETSKNAARFASDMAKSIADAHLVFYHVFDPIAAGSDGTPLDISVEDRKKIAMLAINNVSAEIGNTTEFSAVVVEGNSLVDKMVEYVRMEGSDLVVMGITGSGALDAILMGSNALKMVKQAAGAVLIIPPQASYKGIKKVAFATDFKDVKSSTPSRQIRSFLGLFKPELQIVHVSSDGVAVSSEEKEQLSELLAPFNGRVNIIRNDNFLDGLESFTQAENIDCIITVPRQHGFLESVFQPSHIRKLAYHTHIPILAVHE